MSSCRTSRSRCLLLLVLAACGAEEPTPPRDTPAPAAEAGTTAEEPGREAAKTEIPDPARGADTSGPARQDPRHHHVSVYSPTGEVVPLAGCAIVARDPETGDLGIGTISNVPGGGALMAAARAGVGAAVVAAKPNTTWKRRALDLLAEGRTPKEVVAEISQTERDTTRRKRLLLVMDARGRSAEFIGVKALGSPRTTYTVRGENCVVLGCLTKPLPIVDRMVEAFEKSEGLPLPERLLVGLRAAWEFDTGGPLITSMPAVSASLLVARRDGGYDGRDDRFVDLRIDYDGDPLTELETSYRVWTLAVLGPRLRKMQREIRDTKSVVYTRNLEWLRRIALRLPVGQRK